MEKGTFAEFASQYRDAGYEARPVKPGGKACKEKGWNKPDAELADDIYDQWLHKFPNHGIGLRLGTQFDDGTRLCALDIDDNRYVGAAHFLLGDPPCGRVGSKGIAYFARLRSSLSKTRLVFDVKLDDGNTVHVGELLADSAFLVIPPTIHPGTGSAYRWVGTPLLEISPNNLPIIEV